MYVVAGLLLAQHAAPVPAPYSTHCPLVTPLPPPPHLCTPPYTPLPLHPPPSHLCTPLPLPPPPPNTHLLVQLSKCVKAA